MAGITWWTAERDGALRQCVARGLRDHETARELSRRYRRKVTAKAVMNRRLALGLPVVRGRPKGKENS